ncbi:MAG: hypothetical protein HGA85_07790 [Nanoarchaeota archaeon]|nr:hypothetical protein [Nanoarchaeota archaeon]
MKPFEFFVMNNEVRKITPDQNEARSLVSDAVARANYFSRIIPDQENAKFILENLFESCSGLLDAFMIMDGYRSYVREAAIVYARDKGYLFDRDAAMLDRFQDVLERSRHFAAAPSQSEIEEGIIECKRIFSLVVKRFI